MPARPTALASGELLDGKYEIKRELGRGAMGIVYEALHVSLGRRVAIKTLIEGGGADIELGARFEREARAASAIGHAHIIDVFDLGRTKDGLPFMVMELLDGRPLAALLRTTPKLPVPLALDLMTQVLGGLAAAHKHGIVHRDLKPDNIFVLDREDRPNFVKIVDFGISKMIGPKSVGAAGTAKFAGTLIGSVLGTPLYMSPEQAIGQVSAIDHRTDIYSAGVVLYEMLCGRTPFSGRGYPEVLGQILEGRYRKPSDLRSDIPPEVEGAIVRALSRDIEARFPTAAAMRSALSSGQAEITLAPIASEPAVANESAQDPGVAGAEHEPIVLVDAPLPARARPTNASEPEVDPFAPPPEADAVPLLATSLNRSRAAQPSPSTDVAGLESELGAKVVERRKRAEPRPAAPRPPTPAAAATQGSSRRWLIVAGAAVGLAALGHLLYGSFVDEGKGRLLPHLGSKKKLTLVVEPADASVQIDHVPVRSGVLPLDLDPQRSHILNAAAAGRITRRFSFTVTPGLRLAVRLGRALEGPGPGDPPPLPPELAVDYPESPRPAEEIDAAFAKLGRYADCYGLGGGDDGRNGRGRARDQVLEPCRLALVESALEEPAFPELQSAAEGLLSAVQHGHKPDLLGRAATAFRSEYLAARAVWQMEELSRLEKDDGQRASWHMRRVALATCAWARSRTAGSAAAAAVEAKRAKLDDAFTLFMSTVRATPAALAQIAGAPDFVAAAEKAVALANRAGGRTPTDIAAVESCRQVVAAFNALVVD